MIRTRILPALACAVMLLAMPCMPVQAGSSLITVAQRSPEEICTYFEEHPFDLKTKDVYLEEPSVTAPYAAGVMDEASLQNAVTALNCMRYIAGLPEVTLSAEYCRFAQAAALVNAVNNLQTHSPAQPADMPDSLYALGATGAGRSNLCPMNGVNVAATIDYYMHDSSSGNITRLGHRRWCLNPAMAQTGFGAVGQHSAMYSFDRERTDATETGVCWPAQNMPVEYFNFNFFKAMNAWSFSVGKAVDGQNISVTLVRTNDQQTWHFSESSADGVFAVENSGYGQKGCIIFSPQDVTRYEPGDQYHVTITGLDSPVEYTVDFFSLAAPPTPTPAIRGDVNQDGALDTLDLVLVQQWILAVPGASLGNADAADLNEDDMIDVYDLALMKRELLGN